MKVKSIKNVNTIDNDLVHSGLLPSTEYYVVEITDEEFRVLNSNHEPILYPKELFIVEDKIPENWIRESYEDGEYYISPPEFQGYFFEDYFEGKPEAVSIFNEWKKQILIS